MKLAVVSHKRCWRQPETPSGFATVGGFPFQIEALSQLFESTRVVVPQQRTPRPSGALPLLGHRLQVVPLAEPRGTGALRKVLMMPWLVTNGRILWREIGASDAVHALVPGDVGTLGLLLALARRKPLLVRHCGTWGHRATLADRFLAWLLPRIAGGRRVVLATGGGNEAPAGKGNPVAWIFSTSLRQEELTSLNPAEPWQPGNPLHLITVGRFSQGKNAVAVVEALPRLVDQGLDVYFCALGEGPHRALAQRRAEELGVAQRVRLPGNVGHEQVLEELRRSHLFVFPSRVAEGFPKAVLEAMACGLPVLVPRTSVLPFLASQGGGTVLDGTDGEAVARAVLELVRQPEQLAKMGHAARNTARAYTLERWRDQIGDHLRKAWRRPLGGPGERP